MTRNLAPAYLAALVIVPHVPHDPHDPYAIAVPFRPGARRPRNVRAGLPCPGNPGRNTRCGAAVLEILNLEKTFKTGLLAPDPVSVLCGVTLKVAPGEILGLVGQSGEGKSTLARMIMDRERPGTGPCHCRRGHGQPGCHHPGPDHGSDVRGHPHPQGRPDHHFPRHGPDPGGMPPCGRS